MNAFPNSNEHSWQLFHWVRDGWEGMFADCALAEHSIEFEQYILENDAVGRRFLELFAEKAKAGVKVFLICDTFGSASLKNSPLIKEIRLAGGLVHFYHPLSGWSLFTPWRWFPRTHIKTLLIDSKIAHTGGVCVAERMYEWRDTHLRVTGPVVAQIRRAFDEIENRIKRRRFRKKISENPKSDGFVYLLNRPRHNRRAVYQDLLKAVTEAKKYIHITTAFFVPNRRFLSLLKQAVKRGVEVTILVPEQSDVILADWIRLSYTPLHLKAGFRIFHYQPTVLHSKTAIIDDRWGTVGSTNFDIISFFHNREANITISDPEPIAELKRQYLEDLKVSEELTWERWRTVPTYKKIIGYVARILRLFFE